MLNPAKLRSRLEVATNIVRLGVSGVVLFTFLWAYFHGNSRPQPLVGLKRGEILNQLRGYDFGKSPKSLVVAMNSECSFCSEGTPFYNQITEACQTSNNQTRVTAVFPNTVDEVKRYVRQQQLHMNVLFAMDLDSLKVSATPTVILVDSDGKVLDFWIGKLSEEAQQEVLKSIN